MTTVSIITGGSSGLGKAMAHYLINEGNEVGIIARDKIKLENIRQEINAAYSRSVEVFPGDVSSVESMEKIATEIKTRFAKIDFLILNAGIVQVKLLLDYNDFTELKKVLDINLWGTVLSARCLIPLVPTRGKILLISSGLGLVGAAGYSTYCASKAGIINFADALQSELIHKKIRVYVACPTDIDTPQYQQECADMPSWMHSKLRQHPLTANVAAGKILSGCHGSQMMLNIGLDIKLLFLCRKFLPKKNVAVYFR